MFCPSCGKQLPDEAKFCTGCGSKIDAPAGGDTIAPAASPQQFAAPTFGAPGGAPPPPPQQKAFSPDQKEYYQQQQAAFEQQRKQQQQQQASGAPPPLPPPPSPGGGAPPPPQQQMYAPPQQQADALDIGRAFGFVFQDPNWTRNVLLAGVCLLIPVVGIFALMGYMADITKRVAAGNDLPLPTYSLGEHLGLGFRMFIKMLLAVLVVVIISIVLALPAMLLGKNSTALMGVSSIFQFFINIVVSFYMLALIPVIFVEEDSSICLSFGRIISRVKSNPVLYVLGFVCYLVSSLITCIGLVGLCIGILFSMSYSMMFMGHVYGQLYAKTPRI